MLIVGGEFPKKSQQRFISRTKTRQEENIKYTKYGIHTNRWKQKKKHIQKYLQIEEINQILSDQYQKQGQKEERLISKSQLLTIK